MLVMRTNKQRCVDGTANADMSVDVVVLAPLGLPRVSSAVCWNASHIQITELTVRCSPQFSEIKAKDFFWLTHFIKFNLRLLF